jgi:hypothetical protein
MGLTYCMIIDNSCWRVPCSPGSYSAFLNFRFISTLWVEIANILSRDYSSSLTKVKPSKASAAIMSSLMAETYSDPKYFNLILTSFVRKSYREALGSSMYLLRSKTNSISTSSLTLTYCLRTMFGKLLIALANSFRS